MSFYPTFVNPQEAKGVDDAIEALGGDPAEVKFKDSAKGGTMSFLINWSISE